MSDDINLKGGFSDAQIAAILTRLEDGATPNDLCRQYKISLNTLFEWKARYSGSENLLKRLKELEEENYKLKGMLSDVNIQREARKTGDTDHIYRILAANIPGTAITILDRQERYLLAEGDFLAKMGYKKETMPGKKISEVITPENYEYYQSVIQRAFAGETILVERQTISKDYSLMKVVPLRDDSDEIFAIMFVLIDVTQIKLAQIELARKNDELELKIQERTSQLVETNQQLESFTYSVSHDLRAPLRSIIGYSRILKEDYSVAVNDKGFDQVADVVIGNAERMEKLITDLLNFSKLERKVLTATVVDMDKLVKEILDELTAQEPLRKFNITMEILEATWGDSSLLRQVWINLLSNALKYSRKNEFTEIEIGCIQKDKMICYSVADNGAGFDMKYAEKLFGVFQRLHKATDFEGTGVGLALVKSIISRHGGTIWAEAAEGKGARFYFTLPLNKSPHYA
jgi:PAS domain S-box-containing protein